MLIFFRLEALCIMWLTLAQCLIEAFNLSVAQRKDKHSPNKGHHIISVLIKIENSTRTITLQQKQYYTNDFRSRSTVAYFILAHFYFQSRRWHECLCQTGLAMYVNLKQGMAESCQGAQTKEVGVAFPERNHLSALNLHSVLPWQVMVLVKPDEMHAFHA